MHEADASAVYVAVYVRLHNRVGQAASGLWACKKPRQSGDAGQQYPFKQSKRPYSHYTGSNGSENGLRLDYCLVILPPQLWMEFLVPASQSVWLNPVICSRLNTFYVIDSRTNYPSEGGLGGEGS